MNNERQTLPETVKSLVTALRNVDNAVDETDREEFRKAAAKAIGGILKNFKDVDYGNGNQAADDLFDMCIEVAISKATK